MSHDTNAGPDSQSAIEGPFGMVDMRIMRDPTLSMAVKVVYAHLTTYCTSKRRAPFPSRARIARELGISVRTVATAVKAGHEAGLWAIEHRPAQHGEHALTSSRYYLRDFGHGYVAKVVESPAVEEPASDPVQNLHGGEADSAQWVDHGGTPASSEISPPARHRSDDRRRQKIEADERRVNREARRAWELPPDEGREWLSPYNEDLAEDIIEWVDSRYQDGEAVRNMVEDMVERPGYTPLRILNAALKQGREAWGIDDGEPLPQMVTDPDAYYASLPKAPPLPARDDPWGPPRLAVVDDPWGVADPWAS